MTNNTLQFRYVYDFIILGANIQIDCMYQKCLWIVIFNDFVAKIQIHNNHYINNRLNPNNFEAKIKLISPGYFKTIENWPIDTNQRRLDVAKKSCLAHQCKND